MLHEDDVTAAIYFAAGMIVGIANVGKLTLTRGLGMATGAIIGVLLMSALLHLIRRDA